MTLTVKSKRRQNGGATCVATVEWMKKAYTLRICTQTRKYSFNLSAFFLSCFPRHFCLYDMVQIVPENMMSKVQLFVVGESLKSCGKLWCCKVVTQFSQPPFWTLSAFTFFLLMLNWMKSVLLLGIKFRGHAKEEAKQQPATWMDFLTRKKTLKITASHIRKTAAGF